MSRHRDRASDASLLAWGEALRQARQRRRRRLQQGAAVALLSTALLGSALLHPAPRLVWNASASAPVGLYRITPGATLAPGDMVLARPPARVRRLAAERRYLPLGVPLVKRIAAAAGDTVCARGATLFIAGRAVATRLSTDRHRRAMPAWQGCVHLHGRQIFLLMDDPRSFDGRYFGPTEAPDIIGKARLLWRR